MTAVTARPGRAAGTRRQLPAPDRAPVPRRPALLPAQHPKRVLHPAPAGAVPGDPGLDLPQHHRQGARRHHQGVGVLRAGPDRLRPDHGRVLQPGPVRGAQPRVRHLQAPPGHPAARQRRHRRPRRGRRPHRPGHHRRHAGHRLGRLRSVHPGRTAPAFVLDIIVGAAAFCCLGFAAASLIRNVDAVQPVIWVTVLPLCFISGIFIPTSALPAWLAYISYVFPVDPLAAALLAAYNPYTAGSGLNWGYLAILAAWGAGRPDHRRPPVQLASPRRLTAGRNA